jgi:hypothetical protein
VINFFNVNFGPTGWVIGSFYALNTLLTVAGIGLIVVANKRVSQSTIGVKANWLQYAFHIFLMLALTTAFALSYIPGVKTIEKGNLFLIFEYTIQPLIGCLTCYVVWSQASSKQFNFYDLTIVQEHDGSTRLICNRRA